MTMVRTPSLSRADWQLKLSGHLLEGRLAADNQPRHLVGTNAHINVFFASLLRLTRSVQCRQQQKQQKQQQTETQQQIKRMSVKRAANQW
jgi:hypothetical protein